MASAASPLGGVVAASAPTAFYGLPRPTARGLSGVRHMRGADARHLASVRAIFMRKCLPMRQFPRVYATLHARIMRTRKEDAQTQSA